ncbi:hypothetical protein WJX77_012551 [Trebouxia sp. C0004]
MQSILRLVEILYTAVAGSDNYAAQPSDAYNHSSLYSEAKYSSCCHACPHHKAHTCPYTATPTATPNPTKTTARVLVVEGSLSSSQAFQTLNGDWDMYPDTECMGTVWQKERLPV